MSARARAPGPDVRKDPLVDRWSVIAPARGLRPGADRRLREMRGPEPGCPFCPGREDETPPEVWASGEERARDAPGWRIRVFANKYPALEGGHEVIVESPDHDADLSTFDDATRREVLETYVRRMEHHRARPEVRYVQLFRNAGRPAGATQRHPHAQLLALEAVPPLLREEMLGAEAAYAQTLTCPLCALARDAGENGTLVVETDAHVAFSAPAPRTAYETWIVPGEHAPRFGPAVDLTDLAACLGRTLRAIVETLGPVAYNLFVHDAPGGGPRTPSYDWHVEILPRTTGIAGFELASGVFLNPVAPEEAAARLRAIASR